LVGTDARSLTQFTAPLHTDVYLYKRGSNMQFRLIPAAVVLLGSMASTWAASPQVKHMNVDVDQVTSWNQFANRVYDLHLRQIAGREIRQTEVTEVYSGTAARGYAYTETNYHDARTGLLLSRVRVNRDRPKELQIVEVYIHDQQGRVMRDFAAIYLPWARNAPISTLINVHQYNNDLHAYRQFDASGNLIYEQCNGKYAGKQVEISLEQYEIRPPATATDAYQKCFMGLQGKAGAYLLPH
jgi:hypothetical protein